MLACETGFHQGALGTIGERTVEDQRLKSAY